MKHFAILTSLLALTACGGGGSSTGGISASATTTDAITSNAKITSLPTSVVTSGTATASTVRSATLADGSTEYDMSDVNFKATDDGFGMTYTFGIDEDKKITSITVTNDDESTMTFTRDGDTNNFAGQVNTGDADNLTDAVLSYNSLGKEIGLKYSDFGTMEIDIDENWMAIFIAGYDVKEIETANITSETTFEGQAVGCVASNLTGADKDDVSYLSLLTDDAKLIFNNGTSTLTANFDNWYDVEYVSASGTDSVTLANTDGANIDSAFYWVGDTDGTAGTTLAASDDGVTLNSDIRYYGEDAASEAVAAIQAKESTGDDIGIRVSLGFGGTIQ